jgi:hypothetical protein
MIDRRGASMPMIVMIGMPAMVVGGIPIMVGIVAIQVTAILIAASIVL